jgi:hypothetical protein
VPACNKLTAAPWYNQLVLMKWIHEWRARTSTISSRSWWSPGREASPGQLSHTIRGLEERLGLRLIERQELFCCAVVWMSAIVAPASTPLISARQGFTCSRRSEAGCPEFSRMADAISLHLLVTSSVQAFSETRSAYYALC